MKEWEEVEAEVWKTTPDKEMTRSILKMADVRLRAIESLNKKEFMSIIVENYYEVIKELITALMSADGLKTLRHEVLIVYLKKFHKSFDRGELFIIDQLRQTRNKIVYKGFFVQEAYLERNENKLRMIIEKPRKIITQKLGY